MISETIKAKQSIARLKRIMYDKDVTRDIYYDGKRLDLNHLLTTMKDHYKLHLKGE